MSAPVKPTLHEIAAMPYSETLKAMREHYDPLYGFDHGEGAKHKYTIEVKYSISSVDYQTVEVEAENEEQAIELAEDEAYRVTSGLGDDFEALRSTIKKIAPAEQSQ